MANIAVFGGTFNPFHIGHYQILKALCDSPMFDKVLLIPDRIPPHKKADFSVSDSDRIEMCRLVCEDFSKSELCLIEFMRDGKSYTVDTVSLLKKQYPFDNIFVACGADMIKTLDTWHNFELLKTLVTFIAFNRGFDVNFESDVIRQRKNGADIVVFDCDITEISSSELRENFNEEYLPKKVYDYANRQGIYKRKNN